MHFKSIGHLLLIASVLLTTPLPAEVYKWVDEQGQVHFGDRPPDTAAKPLQLNTPISPPWADSLEDRRKAQQRLLEVYREERQEKQAAAQREQRQQASRNEKCQQARQRYARFESAGGIYQKDDIGERSYLDRAAREQFMQNLRKEVKQWCR